MWQFHIVGALNKVIAQFKTPWGYALSVFNYRQQYGQWKSITWSTEQVAATAIATPEEGGSIEMTDLFFSALKATGSTVTLTMTDGTNTETLITVLLTNEAVRITHSVQGRMQGWKGAILKYAVTGANSTGSITIGYVKHSAADTEEYSIWNSKR